MNQEYEKIEFHYDDPKPISIFLGLLSLAVWIGVIISIIAKNDDDTLFLSLCAFVPLLGIPLILINHQWWLINENEIIVRNIFGIKNKITYNDIKMIKIVRVHYISSHFLPCYIINDSKNKIKPMSGTAYNDKKGIFKIPVTEISKKYLDKYMMST